ncbi:uncharacterized protein DUF4169 [Pacificibacter maritimus]|uniref:Uncharacterized protein DUF4169 n=1 Tax=Pacificibacter maritimus TaxID=762213 RepID=A0A3N4USA8_9RHOB|nr:DUF4169 family protein [Pacificibacter maritimus]RPE71575.1 uncharacterized protein DUF4169 [Pacificibacter maritimus]
MSTPINLNKFRKIKARADKRLKADENSLKFGRSKAQKAAEKAQSNSLQRHLDAHKRDRSE